MSRAARRRLTLIRLANQARDDRNWDVAAGLYRMVLDQAPREMPIWVQYGHALKESGHPVEAENAYRTALVHRPRDADAHLQLGHVLKIQGKIDDARAAYRISLSLDRSQSDAERELAALGDEPVSEQPGAKPAVWSVPSANARLIAKGDRARDARDWPLAVRLYGQALRQEPRNPPIWVQYGHALKESGDPASAESAYRRAMAYDLRDADTYLHLGHVLKLQGRTEEAQAAYLRALARDPTMSYPIGELRGLGWSETAMNALTGALGTDEPTGSQHLKGDFARRLDQKLREAHEALGRTTAEAVNRHASVSAAPASGYGRTLLPPSPRKFRVLYVSGIPETPSHDYRVDHYISALALHGIEADWIRSDQCEQYIDQLRVVSLVVFFRVAMLPEVRRFVAEAEDLAIPLVYDCDDYVFEPAVSIPRYVDGIRFLPEHELPNYYRGPRLYRSMFIRCQFATFTSKFLVERGEALGRRSFLLLNGLDRAYLDARPREWLPETTSVIIGYTPGTRTHQKDFRAASMALSRVLVENPNAVLRIVGDFDIDEIEECQPVRGKIEVDPTIGRDYVRKVTAEFDISVAPLELDNPFTEAKSELKFIEAACLGVPTVASATGVFRDAIRHGVTGFLATSEEEWYRALTSLVRDLGLRRRIGSTARQQVLTSYSPRALGEKARQAYAEIIRASRASTGRSDNRLTVTMVLPKPDADDESLARAIWLMRALSRRGHDIAIHFLDAPTEISAGAIRDQYGLLDHDVVGRGKSVLRPCDVVIATSFDCAKFLQDQPDCAAAKAYLIADFRRLLEANTAENMRVFDMHLISPDRTIRDQLRDAAFLDSDMVPAPFAVDGFGHIDRDGYETATGERNYAAALAAEEEVADWFEQMLNGYLG